MPTAEEYLLRADDCARLAKIAANGEVRQMLLHLEVCWRAFATTPTIGGEQRVLMQMGPLRGPDITKAPLALPPAVRQMSPYDSPNRTATP